MSWVSTSSVAPILVKSHYLGPIKRGTAWRDDYGVIIFATPTARRVPQHWLELVRWCITSEVENAGSRQWAAFVRALRALHPGATTVISYSDPSVGHTGALYRACNWLWAPTWHRLRPPPTGNGAWSTKGPQSVKDRWVFPLGADPEREALLTVQDASILRRLPWARYAEPMGVPFSRLRELAA